MDVRDRIFVVAAITISKLEGYSYFSAPSLRARIRELPHPFVPAKLYHPITAETFNFFRFISPGFGQPFWIFMINFGKIFIESMTNFIPIFPLGVVVFPGEELNLHIFEPRYKQLISDIKESKKHFGIPSVINNRMSEMGTLIELVEIKEVYNNGEMDIRTRGLKVFRVLEILKSVPDKLYSGAIVNYPQNHPNGSRAVMEKIIAGIRRLHTVLKVNKVFTRADEELWSYDIAHHAGLSLAEEYELLELAHESQREEYLRQHLIKVLPVATEMEVLKDRIQLNGHFKNLSGFDL